MESALAAPLLPRDIAAARRAAMLKRLMGDLIGSLVAEDGLTDISCNSDGWVWATRLGRGKECVGRLSPEDAEKLIYTVGKAAGESVGRERPFLAAELETEAGLLRVQGFLPPVTPHPSIIIRKHAGRVITLAEYVSQQVITGAQRQRLEQAVERRENVLICGGTGAGKSTLMNALLAAVAERTPGDRVVCIERTRELRCDVPDVEFLRVNEGYSAQQALQDVLRAGPDRIMVGEVRGAEAQDMLMAWNTGHDGGFCTIHAKTSSPNPRAALLRLEQAAGLANPTANFRPVIGETVDLIVCIAKDPTNGAAGRRVTHIASVQGFDGADYRIEMEPA